MSGHGDGGDGEEAVLKVKAFHSAHPADPQVYHDDDECPAGRDIPWWNRRPGADERPRCATCVEIEALRPRVTAAG